MSNASERANGQASGPLLQSVFLAVIGHSGQAGSIDGSLSPSTTKRGVGERRPEPQKISSFSRQNKNVFVKQ